MYLWWESITSDSVIRCDEIIHATDSVSANVTSAVSTNIFNKKVINKIDCYILDKVLLVIILLFIIAIICFYYSKNKPKKTYCCTNNIKNGA